MLCMTDSGIKCPGSLQIFGSAWSSEDYEMGVWATYAEGPFTLKSSDASVTDRKSGCWLPLRSI
jgi:hypothetical protein